MERRGILMIGASFGGREGVAALEKLGYSVDSSEGTLDGLLALRRLRPRLVIVDMGLPDGEAWELVRALRADPVSSQIPIAVAAADSDEAREGLVLGAALAALKPLTPEILVKLVRRSLGRELDTPPAAQRR